VPLVPDDFDVPARLETARFSLRMLSVRDLVPDFEAMHDRASPDGEHRGAPGLTLEQNLVDLGWHEKEFQLRRSFAYTVVAPDESRVLGCVYLVPSEEADAEVHLWVRRDAWQAGLDEELERTVRAWVGTGWPFATTVHPKRDG
jgi:hypothetical protein